MKSKYKIIIISGLVIILFGSLSAWYIFTQKFSDTKTVKSDYSVSAMDLINEFTGNESLANKKFAEKVVTVRGTVSEVEYSDTVANIKFIQPETASYIIFSFQQQDVIEAKKLKVGDSVSIKASCSGGTFSKILGTEFISFKRAAIDQTFNKQSTK